MLPHAAVVGGASGRLGTGPLTPGPPAGPALPASSTSIEHSVEGPSWGNSNALWADPVSRVSCPPPGRMMLRLFPNLSPTGL